MRRRVYIGILAVLLSALFFPILEREIGMEAAIVISIVVAVYLTVRWGNEPTVHYPKREKAKES